VDWDCIAALPSPWFAVPFAACSARAARAARAREKFIHVNKMELPLNVFPVQTMAALRTAGTSAALAAERRALAQTRESARQEAERDERKLRGAGIVELERLRRIASAGETKASAEGAAAEKQRMIGSAVRRSETAGRELQSKARERIKEREAEAAEAAGAALASWEVQQKAALFSDRLGRAFLEYAKIDEGKPATARPPVDSAAGKTAEELATEAAAAERAAQVAVAKAAARVAQRARKPGAPLDSMLARPASRCLDSARTGVSAPGARFSSLPRWSPSGTMAHHTSAVPSTAPRLARPASAPNSRPARRGPYPNRPTAPALQEVTEATVAAASAAASIVAATGSLAVPREPPKGSMIVQPASQIRDPAKHGLGFLGLAAPGGLGYGAMGTKFSHVRRFAEDEPLAGPVARSRGGLVPQDPAETRTLALATAAAASVDVYECCGDEYDGFCCRRHHPDDAVVCCKRHGPAPAAEVPITGRAAQFSAAKRELAVGGVPRGHAVQGKRPASAHFHPPRRITPASAVGEDALRCEAVGDDLGFDEFDGDLGY